MNTLKPFEVMSSSLSYHMGDFTSTVGSLTRPRRNVKVSDVCNAIKRSEEGWLYTAFWDRPCHKSLSRPSAAGKVLCSGLDRTMGRGFLDQRGRRTPLHRNDFRNDNGKGVRMASKIGSKTKTPEALPPLDSGRTAS